MPQYALVVKYTLGAYRQHSYKFLERLAEVFLESETLLL